MKFEPQHVVTKFVLFSNTNTQYKIIVFYIRSFDFNNLTNYAQKPSFTYFIKYYAT